MRALLLLALLLAPALVRAQDGTWSLLPNSPEAPGRWDDASFVDPQTGWIVNTSGQVYGTADGGDTWDALATLTQSNGSSVKLRTVAFVSPDHGFIGTLTPNLLLYETLDGGQTWTEVSDRITGPRPLGICGMWTVDDQLIYAVGVYYGPATFLKSTDGGQTWTAQDMSAYAGSLVDVYFWDADRGIAVGGGPDWSNDQARVLATEDGGATWEVRHTASLEESWGWKISFLTPSIGFVSVESYNSNVDDLVLKTNDGGVTWSELVVPDYIGMQGVGFVSEQVGWVSAHGGQALETTDGGLSWHPVSVPDGNVNRFEFFGDSLGYAMGRRVYRYTRTTTAAEVPPEPSALALEPVMPNPTTGAATLAYHLGEAAAVRLTVFDGLGRRVAVVEEGARAPGRHVVAWDGRDGAGRRLAPGVYHVRLDAGGFAQSRPYVIAR